MNLQTLAQLTANGLINGSAYALLGVGFALVLGVTGRFHFAYALTYMSAGYASALLVTGSHLPLPIGVGMGLAICVALGVAIEIVVYRPVAKRAGVNALLSVFVAALMLTIVGEAFVNLVWGLSGQNRQLALFNITPHAIGTTTFTNLDVVSVAVSWIAIGCVIAFLRVTDAGRRIRAVRSNPLMSEAVGVSVKRVFLLVFAVASLLSGIAGVLYTAKYAAVPDMGERPVFYAFVVAFLAGTRRSPLVVGLVGLALGLIESWSAEWLSAQWTSLVVFVILFLYLTRKALALELAQRSVFRARPAFLARRRGVS